MILLMCVIIILIHKPVEACSVLNFAHINSPFGLKTMGTALVFVLAFWKLSSCSYPHVNLEQHS